MVPGVKMWSGRKRGSMSVAGNKAADLRFWNEIFNERRLEVLDELVAPNVVDHGAFPGQAPGAEGMRTALAELLQGSSDVAYTVEAVIAESWNEYDTAKLMQQLGVLPADI
jgi:hypothetical protein